MSDAIAAIQGAATGGSAAASAKPLEIGADPARQGFEVLVAQNSTGRPVNPVPPGGQPVLGPDPNGVAVGGGLNLLIKALSGAFQLSQANEARQGVAGALDQAIGQLDAARAEGRDAYVTLEFRSTDIGNGLTAYNGASVGYTADLPPVSVTGSGNILPTVNTINPPNVDKTVVHIHNVENADVPNMTGIDDARDLLDRLSG